MQIKDCCIKQKAFIEEYIERFNCTTINSDRLDLIYEYIEQSGDENRIQNASYLINNYQKILRDVTEYDTLLLLTKSFRNHDKIKEGWLKLYRAFKQEK